MSNNYNYDYLFKLVILGDTSVGKTCLVNKFVDNVFSASHEMTIGVDFMAKCVMINNSTIKLQIWDTAGQEQFKSIIRSYYKNSAGVLICYDITNRKSFTDVPYWLEDVKKTSNNEPKLILVGTKGDLDHRREVTMEEGERLAKDYGMEFMEVSSKTGKNINNCFNTIAKSIYASMMENSTNLIGIDTGIKKNMSEITVLPMDEVAGKKLCCVIL